MLVVKTGCEKFLHAEPPPAPRRQGNCLATMACFGCEVRDSYPRVYKCCGPYAICMSERHGLRLSFDFTVDNAAV